jgi:vacuolar-type H+-ATPase subunit E/Vma4
MQDTEIFLSMKKEIEAESQKEIDAIMAEVKAMEDEAMVSMQKEAKKDADLRLKQELDDIQSQASQEISETHTQRTKALIAKRDEYVKTIFDAAREKLVAFTTTPEYGEYLSRKAKAASEEDMSEPVLMIRSEDLHYVDMIKENYGKDPQVEETSDITIGGFILKDQVTSVVVDETLEFALENQRGWFAAHSGLMIK